VSEYELADLTVNALSNFLTTFTIFMSIITAYAIAAFVAGTRFTRIQVSVINICFLLSSSVMGILSVLVFANFLRRAQSLIDIGSSEGSTVVNLTWYIAGLYLLLTLGCIVFMWNVRHPSQER
jgi:hypothetical protein